ncbi:hypothetical protein GCM10023328_29860 [Modestobacter marinus]|uniref:Uncharacterized protein n=1 Tax=Modestobacter marinus TaxID=477641 RepID=A0A846LNE0_9ACTN|nr:hypothetical protein [Modestobacter marinus]NIH67682.1 hypothetical protein [Modestobacter marinus]GGL72130.1 hypothetical protein GCM10011589_30580 [Modestobacter marinus]
MRHGWRAIALGAALLTTTAGCSSASGAGGTQRTAPEAAASAAATAAPGTYGTPVDPSLPDPTDVATDAPVTAVPDEPRTPLDTQGPDSASPGTEDADPATVVVTYSGWVDDTAAVELGAYVAGVVESGGRCTLTLTSGSATATTEVTAEPDASSTSCPTMAVPGAELAPGSWQAVVAYESASASGRSTPVTVAVP